MSKGYADLHATGLTEEEFGKLHLFMYHRVKNSTEEAHLSIN